MTANPKRLAQLSRWSGWIPRPCMLFLCGVLGVLLYAAAGRKLRSRILDNLREALGVEREKGRLHRLRLGYFQNLVITLYEIVLESKRLPGSAAWRFQIEGEDHLQEALQLGRGAIVYTPHEGNFFYYYWYLCQKYPCLTIATGGSSELRPLYDLFERMGCPGLDYDNTPPLELLRKLKKHLAGNGVVFILGDFWRPAFPVSRMFGKSTRSPDGAALLSIENQVPVIPFYGFREQGFRHRLVFEQPLHLYASYERKQRGEATLLLNRFMEQAIRKVPDQWFYWFNADERWGEEQMFSGTAKLKHDQETQLVPGAATDASEQQKTYTA
ncbi:lipid A biosynthesis acyltransferase [Paenibacillus rigui]|uniref:Lipid A biosynthesis acyltransferase n=2 Tax=Paenibacillus rigui TaxID=554312 RepID=A0A229UYQ6_9BACL|nr:lipid A biosynthesis acyltransferase [Paenibacillus rigui]